MTVSGFFKGIAAEVIYYAAFIIPILAALYIRKRLEIPESTLSFKLPLKELPFTLLLSSPTILLLLILSYLTSLLLSLFELNPPPLIDTSQNIFLLMLRYALIPAIFEEMLFRFVPLSFIAPYSKRTAVILSAIFFSLTHCNFFQIPYAFIGGLFFAIAALMTESIIVPVILHFLNNTVSLLSMKYGGVQLFDTVFLISLISLSALSVFLLAVIYRKKICSGVKMSLSGNCKYLFTTGVVLYVIITLFVATLNLSLQP